MNEEENSHEPDAATVLLRVFEERILQSVRDEEKIDYDAQKALQKTQRITQISLYTAIFLTPIISPLSPIKRAVPG